MRTIVSPSTAFLNADVRRLVRIDAGVLDDDFLVP